VHFNRRTELTEYTKEVVKKTVQIHAKLPNGGVLIFLTGRQEIEFCCRKLNDILNDSEVVDARARRAVEETKEAAAKAAAAALRADTTAAGGDAPDAVEEEKEEEQVVDYDLDDKDVGSDEDDAGEDVVKDFTRRADGKPELRGIGVAAADPVASGVKNKHGDKVARTSGDKETDDNDEDAWERELVSMAKMGGGKVRILPLYSLLSSHLQMRVFEPVADGERLIVVATNVAETSLTIPGIKYVVDAGREKSREFDKVTGASQFVIEWVSQASANQRSGRSGRTGPGHAYRLYSSAVFNDHFDQFAAPEIQRIPLDSVVLNMKAMNIQRLENFPFPTPPDAQLLTSALQTLRVLKAVCADKQGKDEKISELGKTLARFPVSPRFAKMLALGHSQGCLPYVIWMAAALSVPEIFADAREHNHDDDSDDDDDVVAKIGAAAKASNGFKGKGGDGAIADNSESSSSGSARKRGANRLIDSDDEGDGLIDLVKGRTNRKWKKEKKKRESTAPLSVDDSSAGAGSGANAEGGGDNDGKSGGLQLSEKDRERLKRRRQRKRDAALQAARHRWVNEHSDIITKLNVAGGLQWAGESEDKMRLFCRDNFLRFKSMQEIQRLHRQLVTIVRDILSSSATDENVKGTASMLKKLNKRMAPPSDSQVALLRQIILSAFIDRVARKLSAEDMQTLQQSGAVEDGKFLSSLYCISFPRASFVDPHSHIEHTHTHT
jgi:HrpA-like RNA helicase